MTKSGSAERQAPPGYIIGKTGIGEIEEILAAPPEEHDALFAAWMARRKAAAEERARQRIDAILDEAMFGKAG
jgi:hypothetical protein